MKRFVYVFVPALVLLIWSILTNFSLVDRLFLPTPISVAQSLYKGLIFDDLSKDAFATIVRSLIGFSIASVIGVPFGLLIGRIKLLSRATQPTIDFFRSIPATALFPLFLFFFGIGDESKIAIVVYSCSLIVLVNTAYGAMQVKTPRLLCARIMGASPLNLFWRIVLPESMPGIFSGLRVALSFSFVLVVVTEMFIGTTVGLGFRVMNAQLIYQIPEMYAGIFLCGFIGYTANHLLLSIERRVLHWVGR